MRPPLPPCVYLLHPYAALAALDTPTPQSKRFGSLWQYPLADVVAWSWFIIGLLLVAVFMLYTHIRQQAKTERQVLPEIMPGASTTADISIIEHDLRERIKELTCLRQVQRLLERDPQVEELCQQVVAFLVPAMQFPELTVATIDLDEVAYRSVPDTGVLMPQILEARIITGGTIRGHLSVAYCEDRPFILPEEQNLLDTITHALSLWLERRQAVAALINERNSLARRVDERTADLSHANVELSRAVRAKDEFLATMSHELRTPLNAILGISESLLEQFLGPLNPRQQEMIGYIDTSGRHLLTLINDILDLSKVEAGRMELQIEYANIAEICEASMLFVREQALKKQIKLSFQMNDHLAMMHADPKRLKQILVNLLTNAVKFTERDGVVSLGVEIDADAGFVRFDIRDSGIGITAEGVDRLFKPFVQLSSSLNRQHEGTGLGLVLVRRLAELHGGSVTVESEVCKGSCFSIILPYTPQETEFSNHSLSTSRVVDVIHSAFVLEDSLIASEQLSRYLQELHIHVDLYGQGEGALEQITRLHPDIIFLDLQIPEPSGWEVLAQLKADPTLAAIPVVIISVVDERSRGLNAGAVEYLVKPISREMLRRALSVAVAALDVTHEAANITPHPQVIAEPPGVRILLAEDNEFNIIAIGDYLQDKGYHLTVARNGREVLSLIQEVRPDVIIMDIQMPGMDGLETTRQVRTILDFVHTPIIALTALVMPGDRERCLDAGANEYMTKPVSLKRLNETIQCLLQG